MDEGEKLLLNSATYECIHAFALGWPCSSFDIMQDDLGGLHRNSPHSLHCVAGTQVDQPGSNAVAIVHMGNLSGQRVESKKPSGLMEDEGKSGSSGDAKDDDMVGQPTKQLDLQMRLVAHEGCVNRVRSMTQQPHIVATWADCGYVQVWDMETHVQSMSRSGPDVSGTRSFISQQPLQTLTAHKDKGYALDWSPVTAGRLLSATVQRMSSSHRGAIHVWDLPTVGKWAGEDSPFMAHTASVKDVQWSPTQADVFASCSVDGMLRICDIRHPEGSAISVKAHNAGINAISWKRLESCTLSSGCEDGTFRIWDLRALKEDAFVAHYDHHRAPITSLEWSPHKSCALSVTSADHQLTIWDVSSEGNIKEDAQLSQQKFEAPINLPLQLVFVHQGSKDLMESHWHPQFQDMLISTDGLYHLKKGRYRSEQQLRGLDAQDMNIGEVQAGIPCQNSMPNKVGDSEKDNRLVSSYVLLDNNAIAFSPMNQETCKAHATGTRLTKSLGRPRKILEPEHLRGVSKECPHCGSRDTKFQYYNNNKESQPRYKCGSCATKFTYNGRVKKKQENRPAEVEERLSNFPKEVSGGMKEYCMSTGVNGTRFGPVSPYFTVKDNSPVLLHQKTQEFPSTSVDMQQILGKRRNSLEPEPLRGVMKQCPQCCSDSTEFQYHRNNKESQPLYKCDNCGTEFTYNAERVNKRYQYWPFEPVSNSHMGTLTSVNQSSNIVSNDGQHRLKENHWQPQVQGMLILPEGCNLTELNAGKPKEKEVSSGTARQNSTPTDVGSVRMGYEFAYSYYPVENNTHASTPSIQGPHQVHVSGGEMKRTLGRRRKILEPEGLQGVSKECPRCFSNDTKFQYFNNNKESQPRYKCGHCATKFTYKGRINKKIQHQSPEENELVFKRLAIAVRMMDQANSDVSSDALELKEGSSANQLNIKPSTSPSPSVATGPSYSKSGKQSQLRNAEETAQKQAELKKQQEEGPNLLPPQLVSVPQGQMDPNDGHFHSHSQGMDVLTNVHLSTEYGADELKDTRTLLATERNSTPHGAADARTDNGCSSSYNVDEQNTYGCDPLYPNTQVTLQFGKKILGRPRKILEPQHLQGVIKECPHCHSHDTKFQYFNNNKESQPRYKCGNCATKFTYNGRVKKKLELQPPKVSQFVLTSPTINDKGTDGARSVDPCGGVKNDELSKRPADADPVNCPRCPSLITRFLYFNNGKQSQPRYKCLGCKKTFTHGGRVHQSSKNKEALVIWRSSTERKIRDDEEPN